MRSTTLSLSRSQPTLPQNISLFPTPHSPPPSSLFPCSLHTLFDPYLRLSLCWLPLFHDMGLVGNIFSVMHYGMRAILMSPLSFLKRPEVFMLLLSQFKVLSPSLPLSSPLPSPLSPLSVYNITCRLPTCLHQTLHTSSASAKSRTLLYHPSTSLTSR